jgi:hypothetical protein
MALYQPSFEYAVQKVSMRTTRSSKEKTRRGGRHQAEDIPATTSSTTLSFTSQERTAPLIHLPHPPSPMRPSSPLLATVKSFKPSRLPSNKPPPSSLEAFIQRGRVLSLYRDILRNLFRIPKGKREEPISYAKNEFARNKHITDITQIRYLVSTGKAEFDTMTRYIDELAAK